MGKADRVSSNTVYNSNCSMKNVVELRNYYYPWELEQALEAFVEYYNHERYHEALENLTPADVYAGKSEEVLTRRKQIKLILYENESSKT